MRLIVIVSLGLALFLGGPCGALLIGGPHGVPLIGGPHGAVLIRGPHGALATVVMAEEPRRESGEQATAQDASESRTVIACSLSQKDRSVRVGEVVELFRAATTVEELDDGYGFRFAADSAERLLQFVDQERRCCGFFTLELTFDPHEGPIWLRLRGSQEIKEFLDATFRRYAEE